MLPQVFTSDMHPISRKNIDYDALRVMKRLYDAGHTAYLVGGSVRDLYMGRTPKDFDVATSARPAQLRSLFSNCRLVGRRFRLAHICCGPDKVIEVATFRRSPDPFMADFNAMYDEDDEQSEIILDNTFGSPREDALRRDFTVNGLFYDVSTGTIIDYVGGVADIEAGLVRTIGCPEKRFLEDPVRMLRAVKFCAKLNFEMSSSTWKAFAAEHEAISKASVPRVQEELMRLLESDRTGRSFDLLNKGGFLKELLPHLYDYFGSSHQFDGDCGLLGQILSLCGSVAEDGDRGLLFCASMLPMFLEAREANAGTDDKGWLEELLSEPALSFGICKSAHADALLRFHVLNSLFDNKESDAKSRRIVCGRCFGDAMLLLKLLCDTGRADMQLYSRWRAAEAREAEKFEERGRSGHPSRAGRPGNGRKSLRAVRAAKEQGAAAVS